MNLQNQNPEEHTSIQHRTDSSEQANIYNKLPLSSMTGYMSNPFLVSVKGIILILWHNPITALLSTLAFLVFIFIGGIIFGAFGSAVADSTAGPILSAVVIAIFLVIMFLLIFMFTGMFTVIATKSLNGESISTNQAMHNSINKLPKLIVAALLYWLALLPLVAVLVVASNMLPVVAIIPVAILLALILFFLSARLMLTWVIIFDEDLGPIKALKRSAHLTKGHVLEMHGALLAGGIMSGGGLLGPIFSLAPFIGRYIDFKRLELTGETKPKTHWTNIMLIVIMPLLLAGYMWLTFYSVQQNARNYAGLQKVGTDSSNLLPQDSQGVEYDSQSHQEKTRKIIENDQKALTALYATFDSTSQTDYIDALDKGVVLYKENLKLAKEVNDIDNLPQTLLLQNQKLLEYTELRIRDFNLRKKETVENTLKYRSELESINKQLQQYLQN